MGRSFERQHAKAGGKAVQEGDRFARIGIRTGGHCADVYVDQSPGGRRRFCSVTCQNRARVAAFRSRRVAAAD
ncbi:CGNR zinc finger domain-containing protein [Streptomyces sp. NPDC020607]|uniref:CGNR zinc finger domain-containing protein n=1 Tax=Streptomyces sp. NPDC020607 TaxID=3365082 RepID=UPI00379D039E